MQDRNVLIKTAEELLDKLVKTRRELHMIPELAFCEYKTSDYICKRLDEIGVPYKRGVAKTGVVALIEGKNAKKTLLLRADIDALPIQEDKSREYASTHDGVMHACGHDAHAAILLGVAEVLYRLRDELYCNVKLVFQPAEEGEGGAEPMIDEGVMENPTVDAALGLHVMTDVETKSVRVKGGPVMACPDEFKLKVIGKGGHGATPKECINPIAVAASIITEFNKLADAYKDAQPPVVISVCTVEGGSFYNIIPQEVTIGGTTRMYDYSVREQLPKRMEEIAKRCTDEFGAKCEFQYIKSYPPLINNGGMANEFADVCAELFGEDKVVRGGPSFMGGDDFAYFAERVPAVYFNLGTGNAKKGITMPLHSPDFDIDEDCLLTGVLAMCQYALKYGK